MESINRRKFISTAGASTAALAVGSSKALSQRSPNETINVAVLGIRSRGRAQARNWSEIPNVRVKTLCDPDENLFAERVADIEERYGYRPG